MEGYEIQAVVYRILPQIPIYLVIIGGIIYALTQISKNKVSSLFVIAGLGLMFLLEIAGVIMAVVTPLILKSGGNSQTYVYVWTAYSIVSSLLWALSIVLILIAVWKKSPTQNLSEFPPQPDTYKNSY